MLDTILRAATIAVLTSTMSPPVLSSGAEPPLDIGSRRELLLDGANFSKIENLSFRLHSPVPAEKVLEFDAPWEGQKYFGISAVGYVTVFHDQDRYRMYYASWFGHRLKPGDPSRQFTCYAESNDGIHWRKPNLGVVEFEGSKQNNILRQGGRTSHNFAPFIDSKPGIPADERYKAVGGNGKAFVFASADGMTWRKLHEDPVLTGEEPAFDRHGAWRWGNNPKAERAILDSLNVSFWDARAGHYVLFFRAYIHGKLRNGRGRSNVMRYVFRCTSKDFRNWSEPAPIRFDEPPRQWRHELYTTGLHPYFRARHLYVGFPLRSIPRTPLAGTSSGLGESAFLFSRDTEEFRIFAEPFLPSGRDHRNWTKHGNMMAWGILHTADDELSVYFMQHDHQDTTHLRRGVLRVDGFVSLHAHPYEWGEATTRPLVFDGKRLEINASTTASGDLFATILDAQTGEAIEGFEKSQEFYGDKISHTVVWPSGEDVSGLAGRPLRVRFQMRGADLYAFRFTPNE